MSDWLWTEVRTYRRHHQTTQRDGRHDNAPRNRQPTATKYVRIEEMKCRCDWDHGKCSEPPRTPTRFETDGARNEHYAGSSLNQAEANIRSGPVDKHIHEGPYPKRDCVDQ